MSNAWAQGQAAASKPKAKTHSLLGFQVTLGFAGTFRLDHWAPLSIVLSNRGNTVTGYLEIIAGGVEGAEPLPGAVTHRQPIHLGRDAKQRFWLTVHLDNFAQPLVARVLADGVEVARHKVDLRARFTDARLLVVVSRDADLDYLNDGRGRRTRVVYPHPELLPAQWHGYGGVAAVIIHGLSLDDLTNAQFRALEQWLEGGGTVVVAASTDFSIAHTPRLAALLPGVPAGTHRLSDGTQLGRVLGEPVVAPRPFTVHAVDRYRGTALAGAGGWPLIIEEARGAGRIIYLTFDISRYPFADWRGLPALWLDRLRLVPRSAAGVAASGLSSTTPAQQPLAAVAIEGGMFDYPGHLGVVAFLSFYLCVLALGYGTAPVRSGSAGRTREQWRLRHRWIGLAPVVFAPLAYLMFPSMWHTSGAKSALVTVTEPLVGSGYALLEVSLGLFANRRTSLTWRYQGAMPRWRGVPAASGARPLRWTFTHDVPYEVAPTPERVHRLHLLQGRDRVLFSLEVQAVREAGSVILTVANGSGVAMEAAWLLYQDKLFALAPLMVGRSSHRLVLADGIAAQPWPAEQLLLADVVLDDPGAVTKMHVLRAVIERRRTDEPGVALLAGFTTAPLTALSAPGWHHRGIHVVVRQVAVVRRAQRPEEAAAAAPTLGFGDD